MLVAGDVAWMGCVCITFQQSPLSSLGCCTPPTCTPASGRLFWGQNVDGTDGIPKNNNKKILGKSLGKVGSSAWHTVGLLQRRKESSRREYVLGPQDLNKAPGVGGGTCVCDIGQSTR